MSGGIDHDVVVIGAGPTGLFAAAELTRFGVDVALLDARPTLVPGSRAIGVHAPTLAVLEASGATDRLLEGAVRIPLGLALSRGRVLGEVRFDRLQTRFPFVLAVPQPLTEAAVAEGGPEPRRGVRATALVERDDRIDVVVGTGGAAIGARVVIVAGGRQGRALVPGAGVREHTYRDRYLMGDVPGPTAEPSGIATVTLDPDGVLESFPLPDGGRRMVAWDGAERVAAGDGYASARSDDTARLRAAIVARGGASALADGIESATAFGIRRALARRMRLGRVVVVGDTAHEVSPMGGQGMNLGLLDAATLAPLVVEWIRGDEPTAKLARWERDRLASARTAAWMAGVNTALGRPSLSDGAPCRDGRLPRGDGDSCAGAARPRLRDGFRPFRAGRGIAARPRGAQGPSHVVTTSWAASNSADSITRRNDSRLGPRVIVAVSPHAETATTAPPATHEVTETAVPAAREGPITAAAAPTISAQKAITDDPCAPIRCGNPRTPVRASSSRSGSTLEKWMATPSVAPAIHAHTGATRGSGRARNASDGNTPNPTTKHAADQIVDLSRALYAHPHARNTAWATASRHPSVADRPRAAMAATIADAHAVRTGEPSAARGLSVRPMARSRGASMTSLESPIDTWPSSTETERMASRAASSPTDSPSANATSVTTTVGPGCVERQRIAAVRMLSMLRARAPSTARVAPP